MGGIVVTHREALQDLAARAVRERDEWKRRDEMAEASGAKARGDSRGVLARTMGESGMALTQPEHDDPAIPRDEAKAVLASDEATDEGKP